MSSRPTATANQIDILCKIGANIDLPAKNFYYKSQQSLRFVFAVGKKLENLVLVKDEEISLRFLKRIGKIDSYAYTHGNQVTMYTKSIITTTGDKGQPIQSERLVTCKWEDLEFSYNEAHMLASMSELERTSKALNKNSGIGGKLIRITNHILQAA